MGDEFQHLVQTAAKLKSHQLKSDRRRFEKWPKYKQNSAFQKEDIVALRSLPHVERMTGVQDLKDQGNELFQARNYYAALAKYESALGVISYVVNAEAEWRSKSIKDEDLTVYEYNGESDVVVATDSALPGDGERFEEVQAAKITCLLNIAAVSLKLKDWDGAIHATSDVIDLDPHNAKAFFRRALARLEPLSSGAAEVEVGYQDLKQAAKLDPNNKTIRKKLRIVSDQQRKQRERDKKNYSGFLHRTKRLYDEAELDEKRRPVDEHSGLPRSQAEQDGARTNIGSDQVPEMVQTQFRQIEAMIRDLEQEGDYAKVGFKLRHLPSVILCCRSCVNSLVAIVRHNNLETS